MEVFCRRLLEPAECAQLTETLSKYPSRKGLVSSLFPPGYCVNLDHYDACESFFNPFESEYNWLMTKLRPHIEEAENEFGIRGTRMVETARIVTYAQGGRFNWHQDARERADKATPTTRRLTLSLQLSPASDYEGGLLELLGVGPLPTELGSVAIFPAYSVHRVTPIDRGVRKALVMWWY